jgi:hypothetical protein
MPTMLGEREHAPDQFVRESLPILEETETVGIVSATV